MSFITISTCIYGISTLKYSGLFSFLRMDGAQSSLTLQFQNGAPDKTSSNLGDSSKDQFYLGITGLQNIDFGTKGEYWNIDGLITSLLSENYVITSILDFATCLTKGKIGWSKFEDGDYTECAGHSTNVGFKWEPEEL